MFTSSADGEFCVSGTTHTFQIPIIYPAFTKFKSYYDNDDLINYFKNEDWQKPFPDFVLTEDLKNAVEAGYYNICVSPVDRTIAVYHDKIGKRKYNKSVAMD